MSAVRWVSSTVTPAARLTSGTSTDAGFQVSGIGTMPLREKSLPIGAAATGNPDANRMLLSRTRRTISSTVMPLFRPQFWASLKHIPTDRMERLVAPDTSTATDADALSALADIERLGGQLQAARAAIGKVIYGQQHVIDQTLVALLSGGHLLLIGVPGLAKTKLVETLGIVLGMESKRIQFTPDLMPADILGSEVLEESDGGRRSFRFIQGPVFAQLLMADEINRASPRTQSALLQSMQERHVTVAGKSYDLPAPFHVLATQNPLEQEGTYPLPEAQLDRFLLQVDVGYPDEEAEREIMIATTSAEHAGRRAGADADGPDGGAGAGPPPADRPERGRCDPEAGARRPSRDVATSRSCASGSPGVPARAPARPSCWRPAPAPSSRAGSRRRSTMSWRSPGRSCAIAWP